MLLLIINPGSTSTKIAVYEDEREFASTQIERDITAPDSNRKIVREIARCAEEHEKETGRFPKTLIFAVNDLPHTSHADQVVRICREIFGRGDDFVQKITGSPSVDRPLQRIREFRNRPEPKVVVTVDMLSTGVDIPCLEFVVFMRPVKSRILWVQMLGRWLDRERTVFLAQALDRHAGGRVAPERPVCSVNSTIGFVTTYVPVISLTLSDGSRYDLTGLGVALSVADGTGYRPLAGEGGHIGFAATDDELLARIARYPEAATNYAAGKPDQQPDRQQAQ